MQTKSSATVKKITLSGLFAALSVVIGIICRSYLTFGAIRISFDNVPVFIAGIILGPYYAAGCAVIADLVSGFISSGQINPIITAGALAIGLLAGIIPKIFSKAKPLLNTFLTVFISHTVGSMIIKSVGLYVFYGYGTEILIWRIPLYIGISVAETGIVYLIIKNTKIKKVIS